MKTTEKLTKEEFKLGLKQFRGTSEYHEHIFPGVLALKLTDGANFVRQEAQAGWLFDAISFFQSHRLIIPLPIQFWRLRKVKDQFLLECIPDEQWLSKHKLINRTSIVNADCIGKTFPVEHFEIWVQDGVAMLPSEY